MNNIRILTIQSTVSEDRLDAELRELPVRGYGRVSAELKARRRDEGVEGRASQVAVLDSSRPDGDKGGDVRLAMSDD